MTAAPMEAAHEQAGARHLLRLRGELTIYAAEALKAALSEAVGHAEAEVDLAGVSAIDTAGVQLLLAAKRAAASDGAALRLANHSAPVLELIELYDLAGQFGDPIVLGAAGEGGRS